jgi:signal transduction histidine kinase
MSKPHLRTHHPVQRVAALTKASLTYDSFVGSVLDVFIEMGFERARYYEASWDSAVGREVLVGVAGAPERERTHVGRVLDLAESQLGANAGSVPTVGTSTDKDSSLAWAKELGLSGRAWVEIPLVAQGSVEGLLVGEWSGTPDDLSHDDLAGLEVVGSEVGAYLALRRTTQAEAFGKRGIGPSVIASSNVDAMITEAGSALGGSIDAAVTSIFSFSWADQRLTKIAEVLAPEFGEHEPHPETYASGEYLTGHAWSDDTYRHIVSFDSLLSVREELIEPASLASLRDSIGNLRSALFATVGSLERRYLLRFINRASEPMLPFLGEARFLEAILPGLRAQVDAAIATERFDALRSATEAAGHITELEDLLVRIEGALRGDGIHDFGVVTHEEGSSRFGVAAFCGPYLHGIDVNGRIWADDEVYVAATESGPQVLRLEGADLSDQGPMASQLVRCGFRSVLSIPISVGGTKGAFVLPLRERKRDTAFPHDLSFGGLSLLIAYAGIVGSFLETRLASAKADGARRALGVLGHELRGPIATLGSAAEVAINTAVAKARQLPLEDEERLEMEADFSRRRDAIYTQLRQVNAALSLAPIVAQEAAGRLELDLRSNSVYDIARRAVEQVNDETEHARGVRHAFLIAESCRRAGAIVCDADYLSLAMRELLKNAAAYSMQTSPGTPAEITIFAERDTETLRLCVRNWGLGISPGQEELIFAPWVRGSGAWSRPTAGMGIGLFVVRQILRAHGGEALFESRPTLTDERRTRLFEGYETTVRLELPSGLSPGQYAVHLRDLATTAPKPGPPPSRKRLRVFP